MACTVLLRVRLKIAIIGAGASGIVAAIQAKRNNNNINIDLFDINKSVGKKILASGNGRCNISNTSLSASNYIGENPSFVEYCLKEFDYKTFEQFCKSIGLLLDIKETSKVYPLSNEAKSVVNLLQSQLDSLGINIHCETTIKTVTKENNKFILKSSDETFNDYDKVLISSGLQAAPQLNATEDGINIGESFGHSFNPTYPSLVGLNVESNYHHKLAGVKKEVATTLYINGQKEYEVTGDVLFTKYGVSGFGILDISQVASYNLSLYQEVQLSINFFPNSNRNELLSKVESLLKAQPLEKASILLTGLVSNKLPSVILEVCKLAPEVKAKDINAKQIRSIVNQLMNWRLKIVDTQGFKHAEVSGGGLRTDEVEAKTMQSKKVKGLYFTGEVLDITGHRGGYNLHFAWASGFVAGKSLAGQK